MYIVKVNDKKVKEYEYEEQAVMYCYINGYVYSGIDEFDGTEVVELHPNVKIERK